MTKPNLSIFKFFIAALNVEKIFSKLVTFVFIAMLSHTVAACGQNQEAMGHTFDVVSVKPAGPITVPGAPGEKTYSHFRPFRYSGGSLTAVATIKSIIQEAYSVEDWAIVSPGWINSDAYDIRATMPPNTSKEEARLMLRTMLADRFGLQCHVEKRDIPVYVLVKGKDGFKLRPMPDKPTFSSEMSTESFTATGTIDGIAANSRRYADIPVINMSGVDGIYHIELHWTRDSDGRYDPGFWKALERESGLKLESRKLPRDVIVVDHVERTPTPN